MTKSEFTERYPELSKEYDKVSQLSEKFHNIFDYMAWAYDIAKETTK